MKIAFLIFSLEKAGGSERVTANLANGLLEEGYDISVITLYGNDSYFTLSNKVDLHTLQKYRNKFSKSKELVSIINNNNFDYVIGISIEKLNIYFGLLSFFLSKKTKLIASEHLSYSNSTSTIRFFKKLIYSRFDKVVVLTDSDYDLLKTKGFKNVISIKNASSYYPDTNLIKPLSDRSKVILASGRLTHQKGFDLLIQAWASIYHLFPDWSLCIVGEGSLKKDLISLISGNFKNDTACKILSFTNRMDKYYNNSQIFVLSSRFEGLPMVMIEAACFGCPLISFDCKTGPNEIIQDGLNGNLVPNQDISKLSDVISTLLENDEMRESYYLNLLLTREKYFLKNILNKWKKILV